MRRVSVNAYSGMQFDAQGAMKMVSMLDGEGRSGVGRQPVNSASQNVQVQSGSEHQLVNGFGRSEEEGFDDVTDGDIDKNEVMVETNISKLLSERTTKVVILIVLIMLFVQPIFSSDTYSDEPTATDQGLVFLTDIYNKNQSWSLYQKAAG